MGEGRTDKLKLSRYHMSVIDELYENRDAEELTIQLEEKYDRIKEFDNIKEVPPPQNLARCCASLTPKKASRFVWAA